MSVICFNFIFNKELIIIDLFGECRKEIDDIEKNFAEKEREYNDRIKNLEDEIARLNNHVRLEVGLNADQKPTQKFSWGYIVPLNNIKIDTNHSLGQEFMSVNWSCICNVGDKIYLRVYENVPNTAFLTSLSGYLVYSSSE